MGIPLPTRMVVVKLGDGSLWVNSPVAISENELARLTEIGPVRYLVAPTPLHVWRLQSWATLFPSAQLWGPRSAPPSDWADDLDQVVFRGNLFLEEVEFFHFKSRTLIFADFIQNYPPDRSRPLTLRVQRLAGVSGVGVPIDVRLSFVNRELARSSVAKMLSWDFEQLVVAHGDPVEFEAKTQVRRAFAFLGS
ncbi:MAG TPA: DUF4336 domain-containing protein [Candidatus Cybelea sp.]